MARHAAITHKNTTEVGSITVFKIVFYAELLNETLYLYVFVLFFSLKKHNVHIGDAKIRMPDFFLPVVPVDKSYLPWPHPQSIKLY
jgi:hypothetical protein